jgi:hypothetical protein
MPVSTFFSILGGKVLGMGSTKIKLPFLYDKTIQPNSENPNSNKLSFLCPFHPPTTSMGMEATEMVLRAQCLQGNPYKVLVGDTKEMIKLMMENAKSPIFTNSLSDDKDVTPHVFTFIHHIFHKFGTHL